MNRWITLAVLIGLLSVRAGRAADQAITAGIKEFTAAYEAWDGARFRAAADLFRQAATPTTASATNFYWLGVAEFHRVLQIQHSPVAATNRTEAAAAIEAAVAALSRAVKLDPHHAESHALLATLYGMKIDGNLLHAARFGPRVDKHHKAALQAGAENPRVRYLLGMCLFHTAKKPVAWRETLAALLAAEKLFEVEATVAAGPLEPRWGHDSCLTFIGLTHELLGHGTEAAAYFRKALQKHPQDYLAKSGLERVAGKP